MPSFDECILRRSSSIILEDGRAMERAFDRTSDHEKDLNLEVNGGAATPFRSPQ